MPRVTIAQLQAELAAQTRRADEKEKSETRKDKDLRTCTSEKGDALMALHTARARIQELETQDAVTAGKLLVTQQFVKELLRLANLAPK